MQRFYFHLNDTPDEALNRNHAATIIEYQGHSIRPIWHGNIGYRCAAGVVVYSGWSFQHAPGATWAHSVEDAMALVDIFEGTKEEIIRWRKYGDGEASPFWKRYRELNPPEEAEYRFLRTVQTEIQFIRRDALKDCNEKLFADTIKLDAVVGRCLSGLTIR